MPLLFPKDILESDAIGGKARALLSLHNKDLPIPAWAVVTSDTSLGSICLENIESIGTGPFAVRSSAIEEDSNSQSYAGQFESYLFVHHDNIINKIDLVRKSTSSQHLDSYRENQGIHSSSIPAALIQQMIDPLVAGVAFSADPVTGIRDHAVVSAVWGVGSSLVSGECDADTWKIDRELNVIETIIAKKTNTHRFDPASKEGVSTQDIANELQEIACLTKEQITAVSQLARACAQHFKQPQDIEWCIDKNSKLWLLQSRPITNLGKMPDPSDAKTVWDNSNIAESYSGVTTPLTFSFALRAYEHVYREFCGLLSVSKVRITANDQTFQCMLGLVRGRVYYNLVSWYRVLALLPGFQMNRSFMEQMMGVKEPLPAEIVEQIVKENERGVWRDRLDLCQTLIGLIKSYRKLPSDIIRFRKRLDTALHSISNDQLNELTNVELISHYRNLEQSLLKKWDAPLVNDFFAMIFYGVLKNLCQKWLNDKDGSLQNELVLDAGEIISAEPPRRIKEMALVARESIELVQLLADGTVEISEKLKAVHSHPVLAALYKDYLTKFGDRCLEELKLESPTVDDDPNPLLTSIAYLAQSDRLNILETHSTDNAELTTQCLNRITSLWKRKIFSWVLTNAKNRVRDRENLRFERTRLFGRVRKIIRQLGNRFVADQKLHHEDDIFYLTIEELLRLHDGASVSNMLFPVIESRRTEFEEYKNTTSPPDRFITTGPLYRYTNIESPKSIVSMEGDSMKGIGACSGIVRGRVRVVTNPREAKLEPGEILIAQQTDPGWVILFPSAAGLLVERGSLLSHSAIVSREMNLPCIVSLTNICLLLKTGDLVEMDGRSGIVTKLSDEI